MSLRKGWEKHIKKKEENKDADFGQREKENREKSILKGRDRVNEKQQ